MTDHTPPSAAQTLDELAALTDAQARQLHAHLLAAGQLPPPAGLCTLTRAQQRASLDELGGAMLGQASAWGKVAPDGSALAHYANGLIYSGTMLGSCQRVEPDALNVLAMFATWAASFAREVLTSSGANEAQIDAALDGDGVPQLLARLPDGIPRGAAGAALSVFSAAAASTAALDPDYLHHVFAVTGRALAGPDFMPSTGAGVQA